MSRRKIALIVIIIVVVIALVLAFHHKKSGKSAPQAGTAHGAMHAGGADKGGDSKPVPVTVVPVKKENVPVYLTALGTVQALNTVTVVPQVGGQLMKMDFKEGQEVKKGEVIAEIDPRTYQAQYDQAVARQKQDQAQLETAISNLKRSQDLIKKNFVSKQDLDTQQNTVDQLRATVAADAANVRDTRVSLDYTKVRAPITGLAGIRQVDAGNVVSANSTAIVTLTQVHPIYVIFHLPEQNLGMVRSAQAKAPLSVAALDRTDSHPIAADGTLQVIDNQIDSSTGSFTLRAQFPNKQTELWPGQFVNVRLRVRTVDNGLVIPTEAVQRGPDGDYVYLVQGDHTVKVQNVQVASDVDDTHTMIASGLKAGDEVVTEGQFRLKPGAKVQPLKPGEVPPAPTAAELKKASQQKGGGRRHH
ncbi:efflux RND transporter periplasmic adaptor subunit [Oleiagrimonas sp. C23AA]|uniref:efflux RND transporter periplasmic adaptor subunit n=1 Tax=Oleiagrimonas sp. C23AA TaxID=2719047 RepID=UPI001424056D|nr:efflux RND transporter periplasmic adaptor subunit [Oleiagrimonas sp. C23AA]NII11255.1 efflux RND transporter periplasmic adaptor subunit [Oleiagrimonas sp. C23AA]